MRASRSWLGLATALVLALGAFATSAAADWISLLSDDATAMEARVAMVLEAEDEVFVSTFIVGDEPFSLTALALLRSAARRGIDVRLLVDSQWNKMPEAVEAHLLAEGVAVRRFHPFSFCHPLWITKRLHDKLLVVDGDRLILGGRNVESPYFGFGHQLQRRDYVDLDLSVRGDAARKARTYFLAVWESRHSAASPAQASTEELMAAALELDRHAAWLNQRIDQFIGSGSRTVGMKLPVLGDPPVDGTVSADGAIWVDDVRFLHDPVQGKGSSAGVGSALLLVLQSARESVVVESPYLIPTRSLRRGLAAALERGVEVRILTNSLATTDNLWAQAGYVGLRKRLVTMGVELWEYDGPGSIHTKAGVLDRQTTIVGSFNLDPRSANLNSEVVAVVDSQPVAFQVAEFLERHLDQAHRIDSRGWPEGSDQPFPGAPRGKLLRLRLLRLLAPLIRSQL